MSDKHSPRVDDQLAHDVESLVDGRGGEARAQEARTQEDDGLSTSNRPEDREPMANGMSNEDVAERTELARHLAGVEWPASTGQVLAAAVADNATEAVLSRLNRLPDEGRYATVEEVWEAVGGSRERRS